MRITSLKRQTKSHGFFIHSYKSDNPQIDSERTRNNYKYNSFEKLTPEILRAFIEKVVVHERTKVDGQYKQTVEIYYKFIGAIDRPIWGNELSDEDNRHQQTAREKERHHATPDSENSTPTEKTLRKDRLGRLFYCE